MIGHDSVRDLLEKRLPPATLLRGPSSVGKWTLALHLADVHKVLTVDRYIHADTLTTTEARKVVAFACTAPFGAFKYVLLTTDNAQPAALNVLLKILEEPPAGTRFMLVASQHPPDTIRSRCEIYRCGALTDNQVRDVLVAQGMAVRHAERAARAAHGRIDAALRVSTSAAHRVVVTNVMRAVADKDTEAFERALADWDEPCKDLLFRWFVEALTKEWSLFEEPDTFGLHRRAPLLRRMLLSLSASSSAQSRLGVQVALQPYLNA